jgi:hypothetical protein
VTGVMGVVDAVRSVVVSGDASNWVGEEARCESRKLAAPSEEMTGDPVELRE